MPANIAGTKEINIKYLGRTKTSTILVEDSSFTTIKLSHGKNGFQAGQYCIARNETATALKALVLRCRKKTELLLYYNFQTSYWLTKISMPLKMVFMHLRRHFSISSFQSSISHLDHEPSLKRRCIKKTAIKYKNDYWQCQ